MLLFGADGNPLPQYRQRIGFMDEFEEVVQTIEIDENGRCQLVDAIGNTFLLIEEEVPEDY